MKKITMTLSKYGTDAKEKITLKYNKKWQITLNSIQRNKSEII
jgi:hypothetical protein